MDVIRVENVSFSYGLKGQFRVIDDVSFSAKEDEFVSVIGPSGCGKSTLLRIIAGLIRPTSGRVLYYGNEVTAPVPQMSIVFQDFALLPWLTNVENVKIGLSLSKMSEDVKDRKARAILSQFGLKGFEDEFPAVLSGGMKQRVGVARAVISEPHVLLMDEPFSSLDDQIANALRSDIMHMLRNKKISVKSVIMVSHNVEEVIELSDQIVVLSEKPSRIKGVETLTTPWPRAPTSRSIAAKRDNLYSLLS